MKIIAFTWPSNTWKTTAIEDTYKVIMERNPTANVYVFHEHALPYYQEHKDNPEKMKLMQTYIYHKHKERLYLLEEMKKKREYTHVLLDRTILDGYIYLQRFVLHGKDYFRGLYEDISDQIIQSRKLYDTVILFTKPLAPCKTAPDINNHHFNVVFKHMIEQVYGNAVITYENNIRFEKERSQLLDKIT